MTSEAGSVNVPPERHVRVLGGQGWIGLVDMMGSETSIVNAARVSFGKRRETMDERDAALVRYLVSHHHTSPLEHVVFTFLVHCPLFVRSQWHRHRTWRYNEISRRYTEVDLELYVPPALREQSESDRQASREAESLDQSACLAKIRAFHEQSLRLYQELLDAGVCREQARGPACRSGVPPRAGGRGAGAESDGDVRGDGGPEQPAEVSGAARQPTRAVGDSRVRVGDQVADTGRLPAHCGHPGLVVVLCRSPGGSGKLRVSAVAPRRFIQASGQWERKWLWNR